MMNPITQDQVGNAVLIRVNCGPDQRIVLNFDRDIILRSSTVPIRITLNPYDPAPSPTASPLWRKDGPGVLSVDSPWPMLPGDPLGIYIPEGLWQLAAISGGRVLSAFMWGIAN